MHKENLPRSAPVHNPTQRNLPTPFTTTDAPPAAGNRTLRRLWLAEANRVLHRTGDPDAAQRAGAEILVAALDCDERAFRAGYLTGGPVPVNLPVAAKRRGQNVDGAADRLIEVILAGGKP